MGQLTIRASEELIERVRAAARDAGRSINAYVAAVLDAATDPDLAEDEAARVRARLAQAGLLSEPVRRRAARPSRAAADRAGKRAARGTRLSEVVARDR